MTFPRPFSLATLPHAALLCALGVAVAAVAGPAHWHDNAGEPAPPPADVDFDVPRFESTAAPIESGIRLGLPALPAPVATRWLAETPPLSPPGRWLETLADDPDDAVILHTGIGQSARPRLSVDAGALAQPVLAAAIPLPGALVGGLGAAALAAAVVAYRRWRRCV